MVDLEMVKQNLILTRTTEILAAQVQGAGDWTAVQAAAHNQAIAEYEAAHKPAPKPYLVSRKEVA